MDESERNDAEDRTQARRPAPKGRDLEALLAVMERLRDPADGCPWDRRQDFASIAPHTLEEAYEVVDAIHRGDLEHLRDELGDLLFQVVFHAQLARERQIFDFEAVVAGLVSKLIERHPHVFGDVHHHSEDDLHHAWEAHKAQERETRAGRPLSQLDGVPVALPALSRAQKLQKRASRVGFDWPAYQPVMDKLQEELKELGQAIHANDAQSMRAEFGDVLFSAVNLGRHLGLDAERALRESNERFSARFRRVEALAAADGLDLAACSPERLDAYWVQAKRELG